MNKVVLLGRLTRNPEVRVAGETKVAKFSVAVNRRYKSENGQDADFPNVVCFGKTAEFIEKYFSQGMKICLEGRIQTGSYTNKDGVKVYTTEVVAEAVEFAESKKADAPEKKETDDFMTIPEGLEADLPFA